MYLLQKLNRFVIPQTELADPSHQLNMHERAYRRMVCRIPPETSRDATA